MFNYIIDWEEFNLIRRSVKDNSVFIDVGANVGYYTIWASQFNPNGKIYSFEPNDLNFERLQENISCNNLNAQISSVKKAVAATHGFISMTADLDTLNHIIKEGNKVSNTLQVECISLDDFAAQESILYIDYLKIDVEGFELEVLFGAKELILENKIGIIQLEINNALSHSGHSSYEVVDFFKEHNYKLCSYDVIKGKLIEINYSPDRENYFAVNYLAFERK